MSTAIDISSIEIDGCELSFFSTEQTLPLILSPKPGAEVSLLGLEKQKDDISELLSRFGAILFRGFDVEHRHVFNDFISAISADPLYYMERSSPRHAVYKNIYTSTDHPMEQEIFQHSEQSYNKRFPQKLFFYCEKAAEEGGNTPIADSRKIYQRIPADIRSKFEEIGYRYSRCFWQVMGTTWQSAFQTESKEELEEYCRNNEINYQWFDEGALKTYQIRRTTAYHPVTKQPCWFNHCTFFNLLSLDESIREVLELSFEPDELPNQTFYGDGSAIETEVVRTLQDAYIDEMVEFSWQDDDILMIDNILVTHGRRSYKGDRSVLVGMSEIISWSNV